MRFKREAETIAQLNRANICTLYDVGPNYLVIEYVKRPDLKDYAKGPLPLERALET